MNNYEVLDRRARAGWVWIKIGDTTKQVRASTLDEFDANRIGPVSSKAALIDGPDVSNAGEVKKTEGSSTYALTEEEWVRIEEIQEDFTLASSDDLKLIEKFNTYRTYLFGEETVAYEEALANSSGPTTVETPGEIIKHSGFTPANHIAKLALASDDGNIFNIYTGETGYDAATVDNDFLFTDEGVIPLGAAALEHAARFRVGTDLNWKFGLEGDAVGMIGLQEYPIFYNGSGERYQDKLPPGVVRGIPDGEDPADYIGVGKVEPTINADPSIRATSGEWRRIPSGDIDYDRWELQKDSSGLINTNAQGMVMARPKTQLTESALEGDPWLYVKILERPQGEWTEQAEGTKRVVYPSMPDPPVMPSPLPAPPSKEEEQQIIEQVEIEMEDETIRKPIDEVTDNQGGGRNMGDLGEALGTLAKGFANAKIEGINIPVPTYGGQVYESELLGPAVQNLFRKGN